jgi:hypothetical protein
MWMACLPPSISLTGELPFPAVRYSATVWWIWGIGGLVLFASGFAMIAVPRRRARLVERRVAWSAAHAAIATAGVSRDAAGPLGERDDEATELLRRAETIAAARGGRDAAREAAELARAADRRWRGRA